jgi:hypothetical protein
MITRKRTRVPASDPDASSASLTDASHADSPASEDTFIECTRDLIQIRARLDLVLETLTTTIHALNARSAKLDPAALARLPQEIRDALPHPLKQLTQTVHHLEQFLTTHAPSCQENREPAIH